MRKLIIEDKEFNIRDIKQLYPAVLVHTGYKDETTEMSLEWIDTEAKGRVEIAGYAILVRVEDDKKYSFLYKSREELDIAIALIAKQFK
jgi:hypothetical protein